MVAIEVAEEKRNGLGLFGLIALLAFASVCLAHLAFLAYLAWKSSQTQPAVTAAGLQRAREYLEAKGKLEKYKKLPKIKVAKDPKSLTFALPK